MKSKQVVLMMFFVWFGLTAQRTINVEDYGVKTGENDATRALQELLLKSKEGDVSTLLFPQGEYHFYGDFGMDKYCFISNNDEGLKRIIFPLLNVKNLTIDGQGSKFIFHGFVNPFIVENSKNITFKNFSIDFSRPFHSEGIIIQNNDDGIDIEINENFPFVVQNGILLFTDGSREDESATTVSKSAIFGYGSLLEFDTRKRETAYMVYDYYTKGIPLPAEDLGNRIVRIYLKGLKGTVGNTMTFSPDNRNFPGFVVSDCSDVTFDNVTLHHSGGMGILGQRTKNISVRNCQVTPSKGRMISTTADATHFVNCSGKILLASNLFENQKDDATNIHGVYVKIIDIISPKEIIVELVHKQQYGFDFLQKGSEIEFVKAKSLITEGRTIVSQSTRINKSLTQITIEDELPLNIVEGDVIAEIRDYPFVHIHDNIIRKNRARGMLLNCRGKTVVENNYFHTPGAALLFEGDAFLWYEQGGVRDCIIRNNTFDNCMFGVWGKAIIDVKAGIRENFGDSRYNKNIKIIGNTFKVFDDVLLLNIYGVDGLLWKDNTIEKTIDYPVRYQNENLFKISYSDRIMMKE